MKVPLLLFALFFLLSSYATRHSSTANPLTDTAWKGTMNMNTKVKVVLHFKQDTLDIYRANDMRLIECSLYEVEDHGFTLQKIGGGSPCTKQAIATCAFKVVEGALLLTPLSDNCETRLNSWSPLPYNKVSWPIQ